MSKLYGGRLRRFRILSSNQRIQYLFIAGPRVVWIIPPQATTTEIILGLKREDRAAPSDLNCQTLRRRFESRWSGS